MGFIRQFDLPYPQPWEYVHKMLGDLRGGFFVDVGAYDGALVTNTYFFEDVLGWDGLCIEPNPTAFESLSTTRKSKCINCGVSDVNGEMEFIKVNGYAEMLSGFKQYLAEDHIERINQEVEKHNDSVENIMVKSRRLDDIFRENNITKIDYLSIDTEGNEFRVLKSINFDECYIRIISAENGDDKSGVKQLLVDNGFSFVANVCGDYIYINNK
jgi:FkbM family methyltransferase